MFESRSDHNTLFCISSIETNSEEKCIRVRWDFCLNFIYSFIHFHTETLFLICASITFFPRAERSGALLFRAGCCWCLLLLKPVLFSVRLVFRGIIVFLPSHLLLQATEFLLYSWRCPLSSDWLPFLLRTCSRPSPAALFSFAPQFPLSSVYFFCSTH